MKVALERRIRQLGFDPDTYIVDNYDKSVAERKAKCRKLGYLMNPLTVIERQAQNPETVTALQPLQALQVTNQRAELLLQEDQDISQQVPDDIMLHDVPVDGSRILNLDFEEELGSEHFEETMARDEFGR